jgi:PhoH-like ATPase
MILADIPNGDSDTFLSSNVADNRILKIAYSLHKEGRQVVFVSKDINARLKADAIGLIAVDFEKQKVNFDEFYSGHSTHIVPTETINAFLKQKEIEEETISNYPNEFVTLVDEQNERHTAVGRVVKPGHLVALKSGNEHIWNISARNIEQRICLELLMNPDVQIVTIVGKAGTGKTLLALAVGLATTLKTKDYDRILVSRPIIPMGKDIGYLPGDKDEKIAHWMQPIFDNLTYLLRKDTRKESTTTSRKKKDRTTAQDRMNQLVRDNIIGLEALTYIRGRTIPGQYVIVDEAQNLTPHEVKTIISRAGEGTKMVLTGDPYQIDNPYLDASSNGLTYTAERLKDHTIHGHVTLRTSERSTLAAIAAEYL